MRFVRRLPRRRVPCRIVTCAPGLQLVLSVGDDLFVGLEARVDECLPLADLRDLDRADRDRAIRIDHIGIGALRALLHDRSGYGQAVMPRVEEQPRVNELTRPQQMLLVGKFALAA